MCDIFPTTFRGSAHAWYNNLEPNSIAGFIDLCAKLEVRFGTSIPGKEPSHSFSMLPKNRVSLHGHI